MDYSTYLVIVNVCCLIAFRYLSMVIETVVNTIIKMHSDKMSFEDAFEDAVENAVDRTLTGMFCDWIIAKWNKHVEKKYVTIEIKSK